MIYNYKKIKAKHLNMNWIEIYKKYIKVINKATRQIFKKNLKKKN